MSTSRIREVVVVAAGLTMSTALTAAA